MASPPGKNFFLCWGGRQFYWTTIIYDNFYGHVPPSHPYFAHWYASCKSIPIEAIKFIKVGTLGKKHCYLKNEMQPKDTKCNFL